MEEDRIAGGRTISPKKKIIRGKGIRAKKGGEVMRLKASLHEGNGRLQGMGDRGESPCRSFDTVESGGKEGKGEQE